MVARRLEVDKDLNSEECNTVLKALGFYQIHLYDQMRKEEAETSHSSGLAALRLESSVTSDAIKKIHRVLENLSKSEDQNC